MAIDWTASMKQSYEFYVIDPSTWKNDHQIDDITSATLDRDSEDSTLGSASFDCTGVLDECYIRVYLVAIQNGETYKEVLGTFLVQTPSTSFDGRNKSITMDGYTPLLELKDTDPEIGYTVFAGDNIMDLVSALTAENCRAPVVPASSSDILYTDFVANLDDSWLTFLTDLMANANYTFSVDAEGRILFAPDQETNALQPVWEYTDDNSSILYPDVDMEQDLYGIPNVVEVVYSTGTSYMVATATNDSTSSPVSTVNRGRKVIYRETNPSVLGTPTQEYLDEYAEMLLREKSSLEHTVTYTHGYCPARVGDCVLLNYKKAGLKAIKAKVTSQSIKCETGCPVEETAVYTTQLWEE